MSKNSKLFPSFDDLAKRKTSSKNDYTNDNNENNNNNNDINNNNDLNNNNNDEKEIENNGEKNIGNSSLVDNISVDTTDIVNEQQLSTKEEHSEYNDLDNIRVSPPKRKYTKKMSVLERLAKEKKKKVQHGFYLDHDVSEALKSIAGTGRNGVASAFVNEAIRDALEREGLL